MGLVSSRSIFSKIKRRLLREKSLSTFFAETLCTLFYFITRLEKKLFGWIFLSQRFFMPTLILQMETGEKSKEGVPANKDVFTPSPRFSSGQSEAYSRSGIKGLVYKWYYRSGIIGLVYKFGITGLVLQVWYISLVFQVWYISLVLQVWYYRSGI